MIFKLSLSLIFFAATFVHAGVSSEVIIEWLVYPASFSVFARDSLKVIGKEQDRQPIKITKLEILESNPDFYRLTTSTVTDMENNVLVTLESQGRIKKLRSIPILHVYDNLTGGVDRMVGTQTVYLDEPKQFQVEVTTP